MKYFLLVVTLLLGRSILYAQFDQHTWFIGDDGSGVQTGIRFGLVDN